MPSTISGHEAQRDYLRTVRTETLQRWVDQGMYRPGSPLWQAAKDVIFERTQSVARGAAFLTGLRRPVTDF